MEQQDKLYSSVRNYQELLSVMEAFLLTVPSDKILQYKDLATELIIFAAKYYQDQCFIALKSQLGDMRENTEYN